MAHSLGVASFTIAFTALISCEPAPAAPPVATAGGAPAKSATAEVVQAPASAATPATPPPPEEAPKGHGPAPVARYTGFALPESVLYDADRDRYLVSNINGAPADKDNNGFISVLSPDGQVTALKWIEAGKNDVKLDAPKGLALSKGVLYVADLTVVRMFDVTSGAPKGQIPVPGSTFLNDLADGPDGKIYLSDSGMKASPEGKLVPDGTDAVYVIEGGHAHALAKGADLGGPNGVIWTDQGLAVCTLRSNEVYRLDAKGVRKDITTTPAGHLDGLLVLGDSLLVTSHDGSAIYRGKLGGTFEPVLTEQKVPADIGYDTKRGRLLVPHLRENTVESYELK